MTETTAIDKNTNREETPDERLFRKYIRALNTPIILPPDVYLDKYAPSYCKEEDDARRI